MNSIDYSFKISGELAVGEMIFDYAGDRVHICDKFEMQDDKIKTITAYFGGLFEAPQWRARWVEGSARPQPPVRKQDRRMKPTTVAVIIGVIAVLVLLLATVYARFFI